MDFYKLRLAHGLTYYTMIIRVEAMGEGREIES